MQIHSWGNPIDWLSCSILILLQPQPGPGQPQNLSSYPCFGFSSWIKHSVSLFSSGLKINSCVSTTGCSCSIFSGTPSCPWCCISKPTQRCEMLQTIPTRAKWGSGHRGAHPSHQLCGGSNMSRTSLRTLGYEHPLIRVTQNLPTPPHTHTLLAPEPPNPQFSSQIPQSSIYTMGLCRGHCRVGDKR